jgi:hypothetical protein
VAVANVLKASIDHTFECQRPQDVVIGCIVGLTLNDLCHRLFDLGTCHISMLALVRNLMFPCRPDRFQARCRRRDAMRGACLASRFDSAPSRSPFRNDLSLFGSLDGSPIRTRVCTHRHRTSPPRGPEPSLKRQRVSKVARSSRDGIAGTTTSACILPSADSDPACRRQKQRVVLLERPCDFRSAQAR